MDAGTRIGPYEILEPLGKGAVGEVYRAQDTRLGRQVAVKVLAETADDDRLERFEREARATALLKHPNIVTIHDVGTHEGRPFLVTELLQGDTLARRLADGPLDPSRAVEFGIQLARAMAAAHALRIVHRDLKPDNLFVTGDGILKVLDFGLAKLRPEGAAFPDGATFDKTASGVILGTPAYMAPEQLRGEPVDERADLFAVGLILYEMVSGRRPFQRGSAAETMGAILSEEPAPLDSDGATALPEGLRPIIFRCLTKNSTDRFQSARELAAALEAVRRDAHESASKPHPASSMPAAAPAESDLPGPSIAVLPFADMSPTRDQDYLCEGLAEELINTLTQIGGLRVAARSSSFQFGDPGVDIRAVGARLGVATVLEGGVRKAGNRIRVTVRLVDVADGYQRWSERYDRELDDVFAIQDEIARSVATALRGLLTREEKEALRHPEAAVEAYEFFLRGRRLLHTFKRTALEAAAEMFENAIRIDPGYAPAHAGLAEVHSWIYEWWGGDDDDLAAAEEASGRALELAPDLSEAHSSRAFVLSLQRRYEAAAKEFEEAIRLNPNSFEAHYLYARSCFAWGRIERSAELFRRAGELRPEDFQSMILWAQSLSLLGREDDAIEARHEGIRRADRQLELDPTDARALSLGAVVLFEVGQRERAMCWSERALELHPDDQGVLINGACLRAKAGHREEALDLLERTFALGAGKRDWIEHDPDYDLLRDDPRFQAMLEELS